MIGRLNHVAIAVRDIAKAAAVYRDTLGAEVSAATAQPEHGVTTVFITLPNTKIELLEPYGEGSPIGKFLERNPDGGIHHLCYEVDDIRAARDALKVETGEVVPGSDPGAPALPKLLSKVIWTTVVSAVIFAAFQVIYRYRLVGLDDLATLWGLLGRR